MSLNSKFEKTYPAIALLEINNLADGITAADAMVKKAPIAMLKSGTVSQGKYLVLIGGTTASVTEAFKEGLTAGGESVLDDLILPDVHPQVHDAILGARQPVDSDALGIVETRTVAAIIQAADAGIKGANVNIVEMRLADGYAGKGFTLFTGKVEDVQAAVEIGITAIKDRNVPVSQRIIPALHSEIAKEIATSLRFSKSKKLQLKDGEVAD